MKKINTKNILKKIFNKKTKKKVVSKPSIKKSKKKVSPKKNKPLKIIKKIKLKKEKNLILSKKIKDKNDTSEKNKVKIDNLRISRSNEIKPEIKKVKKQETEKKEYKVKDYVVYPKHGVGQITEFKKINIGGIEVETYVLQDFFLRLYQVFFVCLREIHP